MRKFQGFLMKNISSEVEKQQQQRISCRIQGEDKRG